MGADSRGLTVLRDSHSSDFAFMQCIRKSPNKWNSPKRTACLEKGYNIWHTCIWTHIPK